MLHSNEQQHEALMKHLHERVQQSEKAMREAKRDLILYWVCVTVVFVGLGIFWDKFVFVIFIALVIYAVAYGHGFESGMKATEKIEADSRARMSEWE